MKKAKRKFPSRKFTLSLLVLSLILSLSLLSAPGSVSAADKVIKWRMQIPWPEGSIWGEGARKMVERIKTASGGRLDIKVFYAGALVGMREQFNSLGMGVFEMHIWPTGYGTGKIPASTFLMSNPGGFTAPTDFRAWYYSGGGIELAREAYAPHNVHYIAPVIFPDNPARISRDKPIATLADFKGLKIRTLPGLQAAVMKQLGASPLYLPIDEVYTSFDKGVIDALSGYTIYGWYKMGMHNIAKYISEPGFLTGIIALEISANKKVWDKLPADLKAIVEASAREADMLICQADLVASKEALKAMKDSGMKTDVLPAADIAEMRKVAQKISDGFAQKNPLAQKVWNSQKETLQKLGKY